MYSKVITVLSVLIFINGCTTKQKEIIVGGLFPLSGNAATFGQSSRQGMQLAIDETNAKGGVTLQSGKTPLKAFYEDDEGSPEKAANACKKLISQNGIVALIGAVMSKNSLAIAPIC